MQSVEQVLYKKYGTTIPDKEFRTIYIRGVATKKSIKEIVDYKEARLKELEAQRQLQEEIEECRKYNLKLKAKKEQKNIKSLISDINRKSTI